MKKFTASLLLLLPLSACSTLTMPSFNDLNQSRASVDIQMAVYKIKCEDEDLPQASNLHLNIMWYEKYSESRGGQKDVLKVLAPMKETAQDWLTRAQAGEPSEAYCKIKKDLLTVQSEALAKATIRRF